MARRGLISVVLAAVLAAACGGNGEPPEATTPVLDASAQDQPTSEATTPGPTSDGGVSGEVRVAAAASLTDAFAEVEAAFEAAHPDADVVLNLAGSSTLREGILEGSPTDVFASANLSNMDQVVEAGITSEQPRVFVRNSLQIAVPPDNPGGVTGLEDVARDELLIGLCAPGRPCGDFAREALESAGVTPALDTNEPDVRALLTKLELGELDAGIVYVTDVISADGAVAGIDIPAEHNVVAEYQIAPLADAPNSDGGRAFFEFVLSDEGQAILETHGFGAP